MSEPATETSPQSFVGWRALAARPGQLLGRAGLLVVGCATATFCYALTIRASLGLGPLFAVQAGVAHLAGVSIGTAVMIVGVVLLLTALTLRSRPGPGTVALPFLGGVLLNAMLPGLPVLHGLGLRLATVVLATWFMALGGAVMIRAGLGPAAYDLVMLGLHRVTRRPIGPIRLAMELAMLVLGWLLGGAIGIGTVLTGLLIGPGMHFWLHALGHPGLAPVRTTEAPGAAVATDRPAPQV
jgi:uncharacterized membrane protein YczE